MVHFRTAVNANKTLTKKRGKSPSTPDVQEEPLKGKRPNAEIRPQKDVRSKIQRKPSNDITNNGFSNCFYNYHIP